MSEREKEKKPQNKKTFQAKAFTNFIYTFFLSPLCCLKWLLDGRLSSSCLFDVKLLCWKIFSFLTIYLGTRILVLNVWLYLIFSQFLYFHPSFLLTNCTAACRLRFFVCQLLCLRTYFWNFHLYFLLWCSKKYYFYVLFFIDIRRVCMRRKHTPFCFMLGSLYD